MPKSYDIPYSNYPPGVTDDDPYFGEYGDGRPESEAQYQSRNARSLPLEPEHNPDCACEECELPF